MSVLNIVSINGTEYDIQDANAVAFNKSQDLTSAEKALARTNIGAGEPVIVDAALATAGAAADAKKTGDELTDLKSAVTNAENDIDALETALPGKVSKPVSSPNGTNGQLLRTNGDGTTAWVDQGLPTDAQTAEAVSDWLDEHPEATTTVQDHSLTYEKLVNGTLGYVTPEMYGAVGDGVNDDTSYVQEAIDTGSIVFAEKTYKVSSISITSPTHIIGSPKGEIIASNAMLVRSDDVTIEHIKISSTGHNTLVAVGVTNNRIKNITIDSITMEYSEPNGNEICLAFDYTDNFNVTNSVFNVGGIDVRHCKEFVFSNNVHDGNFINNNESIHMSVYSENGVVENSIFKNLLLEAIDTFSSGNHIRISKNTFDTFRQTVIDIKVQLTDPPYTSGSSDQPEFGYTEFIIITENVIRNFIPTVNNGYVNILEYAFSDQRTDKTQHDNTKFTDYVIISNNIFDNMYPQDSVEATGVTYCCINVLGTGSIVSNNTFSGLYQNDNGSLICAIKIGTERTETAMVATPQYNVVSQNIISSKQSGIIVSNSENTIITGNIIRKDDRYGTVCRYPIMLYKTPKLLTISNNHIFASSNGFGIYASTNDIVLSDSLINGNVFSGENGFEAIELKSANNVSICNNFIYNGAIFLGNNSTTGKMNTIGGNVFHGDSTSYAVYAYNQTGLLFNGNSGESYGTFIRLLSDSKYCLISNNIVSDVTTFKNISSVTSDYQSTITDANNISVA